MKNIIEAKSPNLMTDSQSRFVRPLHGGYSGQVIIKTFFEPRQWASVGLAIMESDSMEDAVKKQQRFDDFTAPLDVKDVCEL